MSAMSLPFDPLIKRSESHDMEEAAARAALAMASQLMDEKARDWD